MCIATKTLIIKEFLNIHHLFPSLSWRYCYQICWHVDSDPYHILFYIHWASKLPGFFILVWVGVIYFFVRFNTLIDNTIESQFFWKKNRVSSPKMSFGFQIFQMFHYSTFRIFFVAHPRVTRIKLGNEIRIGK